MKPDAVRQALIICLLFLGAALALRGQQWPPPSTLPLFRLTDAQTRYITNLNQTTKCMNNLRQLAFAARIYASDHGSRLPSEWTQFSSEIGQAALLYCPADSAHPSQSDWASVNFSAISYQIVAQGIFEDAPPDTVFLKCAQHGHAAFVDGSVRSALNYERGVTVSTLNAPTLLAAKARSERIACLNNLKQIGLAARLYAADHGTSLLPGAFALLTNELGTPRALFCPADTTNTPAVSFAGLDFGRASYTFVKTNADELNPLDPYVRCRFHDNLGRADGSAQELNAAGLQYYGLQAVALPIKASPLSQTVEPGQSVTLRILTVTNVPHRVQWRKKQPMDALGFPSTNTLVIEGETNHTYAITNAQSSHEGYYDVMASGTNGLYQESWMAYLRVESLSSIHDSISWESLACLNNLKQIGLAARMYSSDNMDGDYPTNALTLASYAGWPFVFFCPSDPANSSPASWESFDPARSSYALSSGVNPSGNQTNVYASCRIHGFCVWADGTGHPDVSPPAISRQPQSQTAIRGGTATLFVEAGGSNLCFQWRQAGTNLPAATNSSLTLTHIQMTDAGRYDVVITNVFGALTSASASLVVLDPASPKLSFRMSPAPVLSIQVEPGRPCIVERSADLGAWTEVGTFGPTSALFEVPLTISLQWRQQFYRARSQ
jgi:hypothetical protein